MQTLSKSRLGKFTASEIHKLFTGGTTRQTYIFEKAQELATGRMKEFSNKHTDHGHMHEHEAITNFGEVTGLLVENLMQEFFAINENCGATPDAKITDFNGKFLATVDVKCPTTTFFEQKMVFVNESKPQFQNVPKQMFYQGQMQMLAVSEYNKSIGLPPINEHYLVRYLTACDTDYYGNSIEYDLPLDVRLFYQKIVADYRVQAQIVGLVETAAKERDVLLQIMKKPIKYDF
jgi:hypothetical protein